MCFRPADVGFTPICPTCGKEVPIMGGVKLKKCPHCKADMPDEAYESGGAVAAAPKAPAAPAIPKAPAAPKAPGTPVAPKAPGIPRT